MPAETCLDLHDTHTQPVESQGCKTLAKKHIDCCRLYAAGKLVQMHAGCEQIGCNAQSPAATDAI